MVRLLFRVLVAVIANAVGLIVAAWVLDDMSLGASGFLLALGIFTAAELLLHPLLQKMALKHSDALLGATALIAVLVALVVTAVLSDSLDISGALTWVLAAVIVWAATLIATILLPATIFKKWLGDQRR